MKTNYLKKYIGMGTYYFCGWYGKPGLSRSYGCYVGGAQSDCLVAHLSAFDGLEIFQAG